MNPSELKQWRKDHGFSQQALADKLKVDKDTIYRWECTGKAARAIPPYLALTLACIASMKRKETAATNRTKPAKARRKEAVAQQHGSTPTDTDQERRNGNGNDL